ncbi:Ca-activated chloride channel family protein [Ectopseudomonas chengduensis]|uniref:Ca-activated chloride channel family protein n=1 Tax=Ectopseudomonas chengduensis TaxID=489632 RepID=A0A1G6NDW8_9GAMM|nr:VWA domain-containing protein [Pseudomonas chengduensis]MBP3061669.1 VWA domain-containing protein [Pseudomonas chengduensis]NNB74818.1 VWA domain-containing protein [Pseudomonas chengduensis]SDC66039.1 Ca-activated chloride channel family protein [Pseudomonas chengduensis]
MSLLWPEWLRPLWLLAVPVLAWLLWRLWHRERQSGRWQLLLPAAFHQALLKGGSGRSSKLPWLALGLAWLLAILALLGPSWQRVEQSNQKPADPLVVLLELTPQMLATDGRPNRLEQTRRKLLDLLEARRDAQTAIIVYAGSAHSLVPLSDDLATSRNLLEALKPSLMPEPGRRADLAVARALQLLDQAQLGQGRLLLITSALDEEERSGIQQALQKRSVPLLILGVGSREGAPVVQEDGSFLKDSRGAILIPRLDARGLRETAEAHNGRYAASRLDDEDLRRLGLLDGPQAMRAAGEPTQLDSHIDQGYWLLLPLLLLAACAGRRGWLFCLPLLLMLPPQSSHAFELDDLWLRPDQQGQRLLQAQRPAEAAQRFVDPQWQGKALYEAEDYAAAAERFAKGDSAADHYNRGNALAKAGELEAALDAYEQALERQPELAAAQHNKALVEEALRQRENQQQSGSGDSDEQQEPANEQPEASESSAGQPAESNTAQPAKPGSTGENSERSETQGSANGAGEDTQPSTSSELPSDAEPVAPPRTEADLGTAAERRQALEQWLRQIPDDPAELLRRKFWYEQQQRQDSNQ